ncbi:hypothetical protein IEN91_05115 [Bacillus velezensis]|uniref:hypothetical protein n=1 Tax=Bacillus velezensis TaxID=492670 RepID=UPI0018C672C2|nr:hypothetical protein [Bacillus velezensis]QPK89820.1 hypothetical protein IEN91_05115 [Bacillus velezensis]
MNIYKENWGAPDKRRVKDLADVYLIEISSGLYKVAKDRFGVLPDRKVVSSSQVADLMHNVENIAILTNEGMISTFTEENILGGCDKWGLQ